MRRGDIDAVLVLSAAEPTAPHWPPFEYLRMLKVIAAEPARRGAWVVVVGRDQSQPQILRFAQDDGGGLDDKTGDSASDRYPGESDQSQPQILRFAQDDGGGLDDSDSALENEVAGFAMASHVADQVELEAVVVAPRVRGRGLGTMLIGEVVAWGRGLGARRLLLELRASNDAALGLYLRLGFVLDGRRAKYYQNPEEDAMLMGLSL